MSKYIDAEKLKVLLSDLKENHKYYNGDFHDGVVFAVDETEELIDSFQQEQPEMDLEKEIQEYIQKLGFGYGGWVDGLSDEDLKHIARHFYELGLKARKEE